MGLFNFLKKGAALDAPLPKQNLIHDLYFAGVGIKYNSVKKPKVTRNVNFRNTDFDADVFALEEYTWEGKQAFMIINKRTREDIAVVSQQNIQEIAQYLNNDYYLRLDHVVYVDHEKNCGSVYAIYFVIEFYKRK